MLGPRVLALSDDAREQAAYAVGSVREAMAEDEADSLADATRQESLGRMLSLAAPRLRDLVAERGERRDDGTARLVLETDGVPYVLRTGTVQGASRRTGGEALPNLVVEGPIRGDRNGLLLNATFIPSRDGVTRCMARARTDRELDVLAALDGLAPHLPPTKGMASPDPFVDLYAEAEMVRADGGFPGPTCREFLDTLRTEYVRGALAKAGEALDRAAALQAEAGYVWGGRYLAYDDTDKKSCRIPVEGSVACFHLNVDLCDEHQCWIVGFEPGPDGQPATLAVHALVWGHDDIPEKVGTALAGGLSALGEPHVSLGLATGDVKVRDGFDPGALVSSVLHGATRDAEVYADLAGTFEGIGTEARSNFSYFVPEASEDEENWDDEAAPPGP